jgi:glycine hydroxymethyltransferase
MRAPLVRRACAAYRAPAVTTADLPMSILRSQDAEVATLLQREDERQNTTLTLIASENHCSPAVREASASRITDKYAEGYPGKRYYGGCEVADAVEDLARRRALQLFAGAEEANVQPHSGTTANLAALLLADIAHPAGLVAGGVVPSPIGHADVVTMTTHKTLRGPRGGMILAKKDVAKQLNSAVFPGSQGGPLVQQIAAKAVAFGEALQPAFRQYQQRVKENAAHLAGCLLEAGLDIVTGGTDNHIVMVDLRKTDVTGADAEARALAVGLSVNKNAVPGDPRPPMVTSGLRLGTAAVTTRGFGKAEVAQIAAVIVGLVRGEDPAKSQAVVRELCARFPLR